MRHVITAGVLAACALLGACADDHEELRSWMDQQRQNTPTVKETIAAPKKYEPFRYENAGPADPFSASKLAAKVGAEPTNRLKPDSNRRREALESFPLESIRMVGHMSSDRSRFALLQVENMVYQAREGNYAGQNYGRIMRVTDHEVVLKEVVQDAAGEWVERDTSLRLQETKQETRK